MAKTSPEHEDSADRGRIARAADQARKNRISVNAIVAALGSVSYYAAIVLVTPIAIGELGEEAWGIWQLAGATAGFALLLNLGLNSAASYYISRSLAAGDHELLARSINTIRVYFSIAAVFMLVLLATGGRALVDSLFEPAIAETGYQALVISVVLTAVTVPFRVFPSVLSGLQRYDLMTVFRIVTGVSLLAGAVIGLRMGMGLLGFVAVMSLAPVLPALFAWVASRAILPRKCFRWQVPDLPHLSEMMRYSMSTLIYTTGIAVLYQSMKFIASWNCGGPVAAGHIGLAVNVVQTVSVLFIPLTGVLHTRVSDLHGRGLDDRIRPLLMRALAAMGMVAVPALVFLGIEAETVFHAWVGTSVGPEVTSRLATTLRYMLVGQGMYVVFLPCFYALLGLGEHRVFGVGMLAAGVLNAALGYLATRATPELPVLGMVFGLALAAVILGATLPAARRRFDVPRMRFLLDPVLLPLAAAAPGAAFALWRPHSSDAIVDVIVAGLAFGVCTLPGLFLLRRRLAHIQ